MGRLTKLIVGIWAVILVAAVALLLTADWVLDCSEHTNGGHLGGIDCFQYDTMPTSDVEPAAWIGFLPLVVICALALVMVVAIPLSAAIRSKRESID